MEADAVLDDHQRHFIALLQDVQGVAQADGVDGPAPVGFLEVRVVDARREAALAADEVRGVARRRFAHVVREREVIDIALGEDVEIAVLHLDVVAFVLPLLDDVGGIVAAHLHVAEEERFVHLFERGDLVARIAGFGVHRRHGEHAADLEIRVDLVPFDDGFRRGEEFVMRDLVERCEAVFAFFVDDAGVRERREIDIDVALVVDLVERHPELDFVLVALKAGDGELHEEVDELAAAPAAVLLDECERHFEVRERDDGLHAVFVHLVKEVVVKLQPCLVRLGIVAVREDARPGDARAEAFEAHLGEQRDVLFVVMVKVDGVMVRVVLARQHAVRDLARHAVTACRHDVGNADALAALLPAAFELMGSDRAAPEKTFWKCHNVCSPLYLSVVDEKLLVMPASLIEGGGPRSGGGSSRALETDNHAVVAEVLSKILHMCLSPATDYSLSHLR